MQPSMLAQNLEQLCIFHGVLQDATVHAFCDLLKEPDARKKAGFLQHLYASLYTDWSRALERVVLAQPTCLVDFTLHHQPIPLPIENQARKELAWLSALAAITPQDLGFEPEDVPAWSAEYTDFEAAYFDRLAHMDRYGFGLFARNHMFVLVEDAHVSAGYILKPVYNPDPVSLEDLVGYTLQKEAILENTRHLIDGPFASNVLLYGDAGTGKSATVKAVANLYKDQGLRLIEIGREQLHLLPHLLDDLAANPLKFILFIDDLSFQDKGEDFSALKAVLEGSVSLRAANTAIYATSNRRHIVRETFSEREGSDIHRNDTMQETVSLSERFGLKVYFEKPAKDVYLQIVQALAQQYAIEMEPAQLALKAEQFALRKAGRSARAARQLVEQLAAAESQGRKEH